MNVFALTIHKVQSLSLPSISIPLNEGIFSEGQAYVAISQVTTLEALYLTELNFSAFKADPEAIREYHRLEKIAEQYEWT